MTNYILVCHITQHNIMMCYAMLCFDVLCYAVDCNVLLHVIPIMIAVAIMYTNIRVNVLGILDYTTSYYVVLCYVML